MSDQTKLEVSPQVMGILYENTKSLAEANKKALEYSEMVLLYTIEQGKLKDEEIKKLKDELALCKKTDNPEPSVVELS